MLTVFSAFLLVGTMFVVPSRAFAATGYCSGTGTSSVSAGASSIGVVLKFVTCAVTSLVIPVLVSVAVASFVWGVIKYAGSSESEKRKQARQFMIWGIVGLCIILSVWAIVSIVGNTLGIQGSRPSIQAPGTMQ